jgi:transposase
MVAARLFALGKTNPEVAEACGVSLSSVKLWKRAWKAQGTAGLSAKPHLGPEPLLSDDDLVRLEKLLLAGAHKVGFASDQWTCPRMAQLIQQRFGVGYHPAHAWKILRRPLLPVCDRLNVYRSAVRSFRSKGPTGSRSSGCRRMCPI